MSRPCVMLLPGLLCDEAVWRRQVEALGFAECVVPTYSTRSSITDMAHSVLASTSASRFSLAGHSMGGRVALEVVRLAPASRLVVIEDSGHMSTMERPEVVSEVLVEWMKT